MNDENEKPDAVDNDRAERDIWRGPAEIKIETSVPRILFGKVLQPPTAEFGIKT